MEEHLELAQNKVPLRLQKTELWNNLTILLNNHGPQKTIYQWQKTWADWKYLTKSKAQKMKKTAGGYLSKNELRLLTLLSNTQKK